MSVTIEHKDYEKFKPLWQKCRDAAAGEDQVHEKTTEYLPMLADEKKEDYSLRLMMTPFFNATWRTIIGLRGMMFRKSPKVVVPDSMLEDLKNIDGTGKTLHSFVQEIALEALTVGRVGVLVDYPEIPESLTQADLVQRGIRTTAKQYKAESIINWRTQIQNGITSLSMVTLKETATKPGKDEYEEEEITQYRVLDLFGGVNYRQRVFELDEKQNEVLISETFPKMNGAPLNYIPFVFVGVDTSLPDPEIPPLIDLVNTNFHHYRQSSGYERGCFISGLPTLNVYGNSDDEKKIYIGGTVANSFPSPETRVEFTEVRSEFNALVKNLDKKEQQMAVLGARMLESQKAGVESADALARRQSGEESILSDMAVTISQGVTQFLKWFADWQGYDSTEISYELNKDFLAFQMSPQLVTALFQLQQGSAMSSEALFDNLKRGGFYPEGTTFEEEFARIENNPVGINTVM